VLETFSLTDENILDGDFKEFTLNIERATQKELNRLHEELNTLKEKVNMISEELLNYSSNEEKRS
jgi:hypothetical protein